MRATAIAFVGLPISFGLLAAETSIHFKDVAFEAGVADIAVNSTGPAFVDYDNDGDLPQSVELPCSGAQRSTLFVRKAYIAVFV